MSYVIDKYVRIKLSHRELQIINAILSNAYSTKSDWFSPRNLEDVKRQIALEVSKLV